MGAEDGFEKRLGRRLAVYRRAAHLTQERLAELVGVDPVSVSRMERGLSIPSLRTLAEMAKAVGVRLADLANLEEGMDPAEAEIAGIIQMLRGRPAEDVRLVRDLAGRVFQRLDAGD